MTYCAMRKEFYTVSEFTFEALRNEVEICVSEDHKFGTDAFLLADFASPRHKDKVCDLGTGCGIIAVLTEMTFSPEIIYAVDIQPQAVEQLKITIQKNHFENINEDIITFFVFLIESIIY